MTKQVLLRPNDKPDFTVFIYYGEQKAKTQDLFQIFA